MREGTRNVMNSLTVALVALMSLSAFAYDFDEASAVQDADQLKGRQQQADWVLKQLRYIQDPRTRICFAYLPTSKNESIATVSCAKIPKELLTVANEG